MNTFERYNASVNQNLNNTKIMKISRSNNMEDVLSIKTGI